jgi:hypothetical protein
MGTERSSNLDKMALEFELGLSQLQSQCPSEVAGEEKGT